jgi:hypothetical protein
LRPPPSDSDVPSDDEFDVTVDDDLPDPLAGGVVVLAAVVSPAWVLASVWLVAAAAGVAPSTTAASPSAKANATVTIRRVDAVADAVAPRCPAGAPECRKPPPVVAGTLYARGRHRARNLPPPAPPHGGGR